MTNKQYLVYFITMLVMMLFVGCMNIEEPVKKVQCPACAATTVCEEKVCEEKVCEVCEECFIVEDYIFVLEAEKDYEVGQMYQSLANKSIDKFKEYYYDKEFINCTIEIDIAREHLLTAIGFYNFGKKDLTKVNTTVSITFDQALSAYIEHNEDLLTYIEVYNQYCKTHTDKDDTITVGELKDAEKWKTRYIIHMDYFDKQMFIIEEIKRHWGNNT